ncbi:MAG UNVERIFIED_CONTAM: hypothetical protein LVR29_18350 [Microcystis novacekii LVE1205-3]
MIIVLSACYSTCDGTLAAVSSVSAVDVIKPLFPDISDRSLFASDAVFDGLSGGETRWRWCYRESIW